MKKFKTILLAFLTLLCVFNFNCVYALEEEEDESTQEVVEMPSQTFREILDGIQVTAKAKEGVFPSGTKCIYHTLAKVMQLMLPKL